MDEVALLEDFQELLILGKEQEMELREKFRRYIDLDEEYD